MTQLDIIVLSVIVWTFTSVTYLVHRHTERAIIKQHIKVYIEHGKKHDVNIFNLND
jgi:hypothetical protein